MNETDEHETTSDGDGGSLSRALGALPRSLEPSRDLWPGIAARLAAERRRASLARRATTGSALLLAAASVALALKLAPGPLAASRELPAPVATADQGAPALGTNGAKDEDPLVPEEESYRAALAAMAPGFEQRVGELPRATAKKIDASLEAIAGAIAATRGSLEGAPDDAGLRAELDAEYEQEIQTMNDVLDWTTRS
jgi:hypothetical protein